jgi:hypothetical protein
MHNKCIVFQSITLLYNLWHSPCIVGLGFHTKIGNSCK